MIQAIISLILFIILLLLYILSRNDNCADPKALNYDEWANTNNYNSCTYPQVGCMDAIHANYNPHANVSCKQDCDKGIVQSQYCTNTVECKPSQRCVKKIAGCNREWAINYDPEANWDNGACFSLKEVLDDVAAYASQDKTVISYQKQLIFQDAPIGLSLVTIDRYKRRPKSKGTFRISSDFGEMARMVEFIDKIPENDIMVIASRGTAFTLFKIDDPRVFKLINLFKKLGSKLKIFKPETNWLFIASKRKDSYYEAYNEEPVTFPHLYITEEECRENPGNLEPSKLTFFDEKRDDENKLLSCAMEAVSQEKNRFGMLNNDCIIMDDDDYNSYTSMPRSTKCYNGVGENFFMSGYKVEKIQNRYDVTLLESKDDTKIPASAGISATYLDGNLKMLREGYTEDVKNIISLDIPSGSLVYMIDGLKSITHVGPKILKNINGKFNALQVVKMRENTTALCDSDSCVVFGPGRHQISPFLYKKISSIRPGKDIKSVIIYTDAFFTSKYLEADGKKSETRLPASKIIRSVEIQSL